MIRIYFRLVFNRVKKIIIFIKNFRKIHHNFIKPAIYKEKIKKALNINQKKLDKKLEIIDLTNKEKNSNLINFVR